MNAPKFKSRYDSTPRTAAEHVALELREPRHSGAVENLERQQQYMTEMFVALIDSLPDDAQKAFVAKAMPWLDQM